MTVAEPWRVRRLHHGLLNIHSSRVSEMSHSGRQTECLGSWEHLSIRVTPRAIDEIRLRGQFIQLALECSTTHINLRSTMPLLRPSNSDS